MIFLHRLITNTFILLLLLSGQFTYAAGQVNVAVAGNFFKPLKELANEFESETGHKIVISVGSSGKLFAQISNGAPFDLFLSADQKRPTQLTQQNLAISDSQFTYAIGKLVFWSSIQNHITTQGKYLRSPNLKYLAIANPAVSPYGEQTIRALKKLGVYKYVKDKFVQGQNLGQTYQYISSGNIQQGIIALSQVTHEGEISSGSFWILPKSLYQPIKQDAVLLEKGRNNSAAKEFIAFLKTPLAIKIIRSFGYEVGT